MNFLFSIYILFLGNGKKTRLERDTSVWVKDFCTSDSFRLFYRRALLWKSNDKKSSRSFLFGIKKIFCKGSAAHRRVCIRFYFFAYTLKVHSLQKNVMHGETSDSMTTNELRKRKKQRTRPVDHQTTTHAEETSRDEASRSVSHEVENVERNANAPDNANERPCFVDNENLGERSATLVAAPTDHDAPHAHHRLIGQRCFACRYARHKDQIFDAVGAWNCDDVRDAYSDMLRLIAENYNQISNEELANMVHDFYEREIRELVDYGEWSKECIFQHILYHTNSEEVQFQECNNILYAQIQALRHRTWIENPADGTVEPHHKNLLLLEKFVKSFGEGMARARLKQK